MPVASKAQSPRLSGQVSDANGNPLVGVFVYVTGTTIGASTDNQGEFSLAAPETAKTLPDAEHYYRITDASAAKWTVIPFMGRTRSAIALQPYDVPVEGALVSYRFSLPEGVEKVSVHVITASTLAFYRKEGHRYTLELEGGQPVEVNFNGELNEEPQNVYRIMYPTVASRVIEKTVELPVASSGMQTLTLRPLDPGVVLEKIVVDWGGYSQGYLFGEESPCTRE